MAEIIKGKGAVPGVAVGTVLVLSTDLDKELAKYAQAAPEVEEKKYYAVQQKVAAELEESVNNAKDKNQKEQLAILEAHQGIILDPVLKAGIVEKIRHHMSAPLAVLKTSEEMAQMFADIEDAYLRERAADIKDVGKKIVHEMLGIGQPDFDRGNLIICGEEIDPCVIADLPDGKVTGVIIGHGSTTSHAVIIAKAKGLPTVVGLGEAVKRLENDTRIVLDANQGTVIINPDESTAENYTEKVKKELELNQYYLSLSELPAVTLDGVGVTLAANIGNPKDIDNALKYGCNGVGLFRTEFVFMGRETLPTEEEQYTAYKYVIEKCGDKLCVIRTMDIGGDKPLPYLNIKKEENPFLGWRAIRICLERTDIFLTQIKAILRAGVYGNAAIMLPMIISLEEILEAKAIIRQAMSELESEGRKYVSQIQIGIMVETPAAALMTPVLAKECDFFSIGTNDLTQYTLAVDRGNPSVSKLYSPYHPAVLNLIDITVHAAHSNNIWVGMCGEMAGDPVASRLLVAMGFDELSMSAPSIPKVKEKVRSITFDKALVTRALSQLNADEVTKLLV